MLAAVLTALAAATALAAPAAARSPIALEVTIATDAALVDGGTAALVDVRIGCPAGSKVREAFVHVTRYGTSNPAAPIPIRRCKRTRTVTVRAPATARTRLYPGQATANAYVLVVERRVPWSASLHETVDLA